jgi:hypothetical protein
MAENVLTKEIAAQFLVHGESVDLSEFTALDLDAAKLLSTEKAQLFVNRKTRRDYSRLLIATIRGAVENKAFTGLLVLVDDVLEMNPSHPSALRLRERLENREKRRWERKKQAEYAEASEVSIDTDWRTAEWEDTKVVQSIATVWNPISDVLNVIWVIIVVGGVIAWLFGGGD